MCRAVLMACTQWLASCSPKAELCVAALSSVQMGVWRNGSASDPRSEGWEFESLCPHIVQVGPLSVKLLQAKLGLQSHHPHNQNSQPSTDMQPFWDKEATPPRDEMGHQ